MRALGFCPFRLSEKVFRNVTPLTSAVLCQWEPSTTSPGPDRLHKGDHHLVKVPVLLCRVMKYYCIGVVLSSPYCYALLCNNDNDRPHSSRQNWWQRRSDGEPHNSHVGGRAFSCGRERNEYGPSFFDKFWNWLSFSYNFEMHRTTLTRQGDFRSL